MTAVAEMGTPAAVPDYFDRYGNLRMQRTPSGVLTLRFHTNEGPITFTGTTHRELPKALAEIGDDRANKVLVITGTGETFMDSIDDGDSLGPVYKPAEWDKSTGRDAACCSACSSWRCPSWRP